VPQDAAHQADPSARLDGGFRRRLGFASRRALLRRRPGGARGERIMRWMTLRVGRCWWTSSSWPATPTKGAACRGCCAGPRRCCARPPELAPLGAFGRGYCEWPVIKALPKHCDWIVCANQYRPLLTRLATQQPRGLARGRPRRGARLGRVRSLFADAPVWGLAAPATIAVRRWREVGELPGVWHYSFLASNLEPGALARELTRGRGRRWPSGCCTRPSRAGESFQNAAARLGAAPSASGGWG